MNQPAKLLIRVVSAVREEYRYSKKETVEERIGYLLDIDVDSAKFIERDEMHLIYTMDDKFPTYAHHSSFREGCGIEKSAITIHLPSLTYMSEDPDDVVNDMILNEIHEMCHWAADHENYPNVGNDPEGWNPIFEEIIQDTIDDEYTWEREGREISARKMAEIMSGRPAV